MHIRIISIITDTSSLNCYQTRAKPPYHPPRIFSIPRTHICIRTRNLLLKISFLNLIRGEKSMRLRSLATQRTQCEKRSPRASKRERCVVRPPRGTKARDSHGSHWQLACNNPASSLAAAAAPLLCSTLCMCSGKSSGELISLLQEVTLEGERSHRLYTRPSCARVSSLELALPVAGFPGYCYVICKASRKSLFPRGSPGYVAWGT